MIARLRGERLGGALLRVLSAVEDGGAAAVEFAIYGTLFLMIFAGAVDLGLLLFTDFRMDSAVAAAAQYAEVNAASVNSTSGASLASAISGIVANTNGTAWQDSTVVVNNGPSVTVTGGSSASSGTASNADSCYCPTGSPPSWSWGTSKTCGSSCTGGGLAGKFVTITARRSATPLFASFGFVTNGTITRSALVATQ